MNIDNRIICEVPEHMCPFANCDTCQVGKNWLAEKQKQELWDEISETAIQAAELQLKNAEKTEAEDSLVVMLARHRHRAMTRHRRMMVTVTNQCPACGRNMARHVNFCSACGQRVSW